MDPTQTGFDSGVLVVGEALIDIVEQGGNHAEHVGGSPANVALGLARLNVPVTLLTRIGKDSRGRRIAEHLARSGVQLSPESWSTHPTGTASATIGPNGGAEYHFAMHWDIPGGVEPTRPVLHIGSIALFLPPGGERVLALAERAAVSGVAVTFDPNIRASLIGEHAEALARVERVARFSQLVKLSDEDASWLYPDKPTDEVPSHLTSLGAQTVVLTRGAQGALTQVGRESFSSGAFATRVVDTVGAGDAVMSSLIAGVTQGVWDLAAAHRAVSQAMAAASLTVATAGANPPDQDDIDLFLARQGNNG